MSKKPVLLVGNGVRDAGAADILLKFAKKTDIPVLTSMNGVDLVQDDNKIGFIGVYGNRAANVIISECDLLISVGARLGIRQIGANPENFAPKASLIRADIDPAELSRTIKEDEEKHLIDAKEFLLKLLSEDIPQYTDWRDKCFQVKDELARFDKEIGNLVIEKISSMLPENPIVAVDVGQNQCWSAQSLTLKGNEGRILISGGYGSMGCGLPFAIGASISKGYSNVYCITGDGGLQMNIQELETVVREKIPVKILVLNNHALGKISEIQTKAGGESYAQTTETGGYSVPDFEKISKAYEIKATTLSSYQDLDNYSDWLMDNEPCLINITLPWDTKLIPKIKWKTMEIQPKIDSDTMSKVKKILGY
jgi:thiamine pyrophosphate-dependent acetolactate synthase large subunit-like protein